MPLDLTSNLISEAIGILFTVLIVDSLIRRREKKKWEKVRNTFGFYASRHTDIIVEIWQSWLMSLPEVTDKTISEYQVCEKRYNKDNNYYDGTLSQEQIEKALQTLKGHFGYPYGSGLKDYINKVGKSKITAGDIIKALTSRPKYGSEEYLKEAGILFSVLFSTHVPAAENGNEYISRLKDVLTPVVEKLSDLVDKYPTVIDEKISLKIMSLSLLVEDLDANFNSKKGYLLRQYCLQYCLISCIDLKKHVDSLIKKANYHPFLPYYYEDSGKARLLNIIRLIPYLIVSILTIGYTIYLLIKKFYS